MGKRNRPSHAKLKSNKKIRTVEDSGTTLAGLGKDDTPEQADDESTRVETVDSEGDLAVASLPPGEEEPEDGIRAGVTYDDASDDALEEGAESRRRVIDPSSLTSLSNKTDRSGVLYLPRIPPGMGPGKVKHLLSQWGVVGRVYLARFPEGNDEKGVQEGKAKGKRKQEKHQAHRFKEGWIEMKDKRVARRIAGLLNTRPIGGKASDPYAHDLWSLTYLPRFKWSHLSDQIAIERQSKQQLLRQSLQQSRREQAWYLDMVEKARVQGKIKEKDEARAANKALNGGEFQRPTEKERKTSERRKRVFKQREALSGKSSTGGSGGEGANAKTNNLSAVLDGLF